MIVAGVERKPGGGPLTVGAGRQPGARNVVFPKRAGADTSVAGELPDPLGHALLEAARQAFTQRLRLAFLLSAAAAVGTALIALVLLRRVRPSSQPEERS